MLSTHVRKSLAKLKRFINKVNPHTSDINYNITGKHESYESHLHGIKRNYAEFHKNARNTRSIF
jgi:hypothetical protein